MGKKDRVSDALDKIERLKSLNKMMVKEVSEQRKQVHSLTHSNVSLELEITKLRSELAYVSANDYVVMSELEKAIMFLFFDHQLDTLIDESIGYCVEMTTLALSEKLKLSKFQVFEGEFNATKAELQKVKEVLRTTCEERDELKGLLACNVVAKEKVKEDLFELRKKNGDGKRVRERVKGGLFELRKKNGTRKRVKNGIVELKKRNREMAREIGELRDGLLRKKELMERIECLVRDKDLVDTSCVKLKEDLKDVEVRKRCELENVVGELNDTLGGLREKERSLLVNVEVLENRCAEGEEKRKLMGKRIDRLLEERKCKEKSIEGMMDERIMLEKNLQETLSHLHSVKCKLEHFAKQNVGLLEAKNVEVEKRCELENVVTELNEAMVCLRQEEQRLVVNVAELEDKCVKNEEKRRVMQKKIDRLLEERKCNEKSIEGLMDEQIMLERKLQETLFELHNCKCKLEHLVKQNFSLQEAKQRLYSDVGSFEQQVAELKIVILRLEESNKKRELNVKSLETEVGKYVCKFTRVEAEKSELGNLLCEEKQNVSTLKEKIENMEMNLEKCDKGAGKVKAENGALLVEKKALENQSESLKKEIASLKSALDKANIELSKMRGNVALAASESELVMNMLDCTLTSCLKGEEGESKDGELSGKKICCGGAKQCGKKFEMIKNAFEVKEAKLDSMRKQLEFLKNNVEEANKKNNVREDLSFGIMLVAAVCIAYILRGYY